MFLFNKNLIYTKLFKQSLWSNIESETFTSWNFTKLASELSCPLFIIGMLTHVCILTLHKNIKQCPDIIA